MCLHGMKPDEWYRLLNSKVFFWLTEERLERLLRARAYRSSGHTILVLDSKSLIDDLTSSVTLSPLNSGATIYKPQPRGEFTFRTIEDFDFELWKKRGRKKAIAELAIEILLYGLIWSSTFT